MRSRVQCHDWGLPPRQHHAGCKHSLRQHMLCASNRRGQGVQLRRCLRRAVHAEARNLRWWQPHVPRHGSATWQPESSCAKLGRKRGRDDPPLPGDWELAQSCGGRRGVGSCQCRRPQKRGRGRRGRLPTRCSSAQQPLRQRGKDLWKRQDTAALAPGLRFSRPH